MQDVSLALSLFVVILLQLGVSLAVGSSTYAIIFYFKSKRDGVIDPTERSFLHVVYRVLRIAILIVMGSLITQSVLAYRAGLWEGYATATYWMIWIVIAVALVNVLLMDWHVMPMNLGPAIAAGSWYTLFFVFALRDLLAQDMIQREPPLAALVVYYLIFIAFMTFFLRVVEHIVMLEGASRGSGGKEAS